MTSQRQPLIRPLIRRFDAGEWEQYRDLRLEMLADTPTAYVESLAAARGQTDRQWQERAALLATADCVALVAVGGDSPGDGVSTGGTRLRALMRVVVKAPQDPARPLQAMLLSVYVAPELRGSGLADELMRDAVAVARDELGAGVLELGVHEANARAQAFYARHGFADTGRREPYPLDPARSEIIMELPLEAPEAG